MCVMMIRKLVKSTGSRGTIFWRAPSKSNHNLASAAGASEKNLSLLRHTLLSNMPKKPSFSWKMCPIVRTP